MQLISSDGTVFNLYDVSSEDYYAPDSDAAGYFRLTVSNCKHNADTLIKLSEHRYETSQIPVASYLSIPELQISKAWFQDISVSVEHNTFTVEFRHI